MDMNARNSYRATFKEYSRKLEALERLIGSGATEQGKIETARLEVEQARAAHSTARDELAKELTGARLPALRLQKASAAGAGMSC
jgi:hypothetical protein